MEALWNKLNLQRPSALTFKVSSSEINAKCFLMKINKIIKDLESQEMLHFEAAILGRLIYRMKCKFRSDKGLKNMEKTNRALLNYLKLCLENDYKYLKECTEINSHLNYVILPTTQMMEYTLIKTQSFAKLMCRIENVSQEAGCFLKSRIITGQAWEVSLIALSVISRIWVLSRHLIKKSCDWYETLYEYRQNFKSSGAEWLPKNYKLPSDLKCWLKLPWIDEELPNILTHQEIKQNIFNLIKPIDDDDSETELNFDIEENDESMSSKFSLSTKIFPGSSEKKEKSSLPVNKFELIENTKISKISNIKNRELSQEVTTSFPLGVIDVGEKISRNAYKSLLKKKAEEEEELSKSQDVKLNQNDEVKRKKREKSSKARRELKCVINSCDDEKLEKRKKIITSESLKNENDLILFLKQKSYPGMDKIQWKNLKKNVSQFLVDINNSNESVSRKKKLKMVFKKLREWTS
ncbi:uncharacterized protein LOC122500688 isoform X2 [Leptopilina heterotoma]|uniref:uncharacterized protein LOC122500688 isoform X2 n=1 Tax=Leptopilina heterotoma TaxID=63436 RepID=UPI001CA94EFB|nr:uncharacterized protein LOC122500688 isoform X2 [Leptopilina heterotoma]